MSTRSCEHAGNTRALCTCVPYKRLDTQWAKSIAPKVIGRINEYLAGRNLSEICSELTLSYIHSTEMKVELDQNFHDDEHRVEVGTYRTMFKVKQNSADFRATVIFNNVTDSVEVDVPSISRLDSYEDDSTCVKDKTDKMYCICTCDIKDD
ncbi:GM12730 [Drosophila sechellia]|uniref:GM12730 n=1 Tax=Drosophila sechellia TaxID=7238 RepID=B4HZ02_DROSE|nr:GM12730 [Drosophila sechellia]